MKQIKFIILLSLLASSPSMANAIEAEPDTKALAENAQTNPDTDSDNKVFSEAYEQADRIVSIAKRKERVAFDLNNIAGFYLYSEKQTEHAAYFYLRSQELFKQIGNSYGIAMTTFNQGVMLRAKKDMLGACEKAIEALPIAQKAATNKRYNKKISAGLVTAILTLKKANCGSGT